GWIPMAVCKCQDSLGISNDHSKLVAIGRFEKDDIRFAMCPGLVAGRLDHAIKFGRGGNVGGFLAVMNGNRKLNHSNLICCPRTRKRVRATVRFTLFYCRIVRTSMNERGDPKSASSVTEVSNRACCGGRP